MLFVCVFVHRINRTRSSAVVNLFLAQHIPSFVQRLSTPNLKCCRFRLGWSSTLLCRFIDSKTFSWCEHKRLLDLSFLQRNTHKETRDLWIIVCYWSCNISKLKNKSISWYHAKKKKTKIDLHSKSILVTSVLRDACYVMRSRSIDEISVSIFSFVFDAVKLTVKSVRNMQIKFQLSISFRLRYTSETHKKIE